jgi:UDP-N-acetylmuramate dehydrogenase
VDGLEALATALTAAGLADGVGRDYPIGSLTTYRVGGTASVFVRPVDADELEAVVGAATACEVEILVVGLGSNLLVSDGGFTGLAVQLGGGFGSIAVSGQMVTAGGATSLPVLARRTVADGLTGFEWAVGVPGSIGGAVRMNAGGHGSDMAAVLEEATTIDLRTGACKVRPVESLSLGYRTSGVGSAELVTSVVLRLEDSVSGAGEETLAGIVRWRRENQPGGRNAGSAFTNPPGDSAGRLIDDAGLRGHRHGSAVVSERHANFIQVDEGGSADDVDALMGEVVRRVLEVHGIRLHAETVMVGFSQ